MTTSTNPATQTHVEADLNAAYQIDAGSFARMGKSFSYTVSSRLCSHCEECLILAEEEEPAALRKPSELMKHIADNCAEQADYLMPGTPITEAVFRLLLANNNRPMKLGVILSKLNEAWASVIYLKNISDTVLQNMLEQPSEYYIVRAAERRRRSSRKS